MLSLGAFSFSILVCSDRGLGESNEPGVVFGGGHFVWLVVNVYWCCLGAMMNDRSRIYGE